MTHATTGQQTSDPLIGKVFPRKGGKYPGNWICVGITPGGGCILLGVDSENNLIGAASYSRWAVEARPEIGRVDVSQLRFTP